MSGRQLRVCGRTGPAAANAIRQADAGERVDASYTILTLMCSLDLHLKNTF